MSIDKFIIFVFSKFYFKRILEDDIRKDERVNSIPVIKKFFRMKFLTGENPLRISILLRMARALKVHIPC